MPQFAVFFSEADGFGIEMIQALDAAHAQDIARAQHPPGGCQRCRLSCSTARTATSSCGRGSGGRGEVCGASELLTDVHDPVVLTVA